jgi:hypothetical protein
MMARLNFQVSSCSELRFPSCYLFHDNNDLMSSLAPKSYDKLSPCIALPPHSDRSLVPELGYLPCEIQGKFSTQYRPSADRSGLDERREEARQLLAEYDRSMYSLGKRRPKYTEYPRMLKWPL